MCPHPIHPATRFAKPKRIMLFKNPWRNLIFYDMLLYQFKDGVTDVTSRKNTRFIERNLIQHGLKLLIKISRLDGDHQYLFFFSSLNQLFISREKNATFIFRNTKNIFISHLTSCIKRIKTKYSKPFRKGTKHLIAEEFHGINVLRKQKRIFIVFRDEL